MTAVAAPKKIRVAFLIDTIVNDRAGTERQLLATIARLDRERFEPLLVTLRSSDFLHDSGSPCPHISLGYRGFLSPAFPAVLARLRAVARGVDVLQVFFEEPIFIASAATAALGGRPALVYTRRDIGLGGDRPWYHGLYNVLRPRLVKKFDRAVANSEQVRRWILETDGVTADRVRVIYNGVDHAAAARLSPLFDRYPGAFWIGMVANLNPIKRHDLLLDAFAAALSEDPGRNWRLLLVGGGKEEPRLRRRAARNGITERVHFAGSVADPAPYVAGLDVAVSCSDREGLSNAVIECMAAGRPIIATNVGGNRELVSGENGIRIPPGNATALKNALAELARDSSRRQALGDASRAKANRLFSWKRTMSDVESLLVDAARSSAEEPAAAGRTRAG